MEENQERNGVEMKAIGEGKTVEEAEIDALDKLEELVGACQPDQVEYTVISGGSKGFLGMGSAMAQVEARLVGSETGAAQERLRELLKKVAASFGLEVSVNITDRGDEIVADLVGDDLGLFIGRHGSTLDAIQYLANIIVFRELEGRKRIVIDAEDYRGRREEVLRSMADRGASEVMKGKPEYEMQPMSAAERRIIHLHLQDRAGIETTSEGREPFRRVVITRAEC